MESIAIKSAASGRWESILAALAPQLRPALERVGHHVPCPVHGGRDGYRVFADVAESGGSVCNTCGIHADGFSTLMWATGCDFPTTLAAVSDFLNLVRRESPMPVRCIKIGESDGMRDEAARTALNRVWNESVTLTNREAEPGRLYLARRGIGLAPPDTLRFHPNLAYYEDSRLVGCFPALLAMVGNAAGSAVTIHRTYLTGDGQKAPVGAPKKMMRFPSGCRLAGGAIRLADPGYVLGVAEGVETALAVMEGIGMPVWSAVNAYLLEHFVPPPEVRQVLVFADKDRPTPQHPHGHGQEAARQLVQRLWKMGVKASAIVPAGEIPAGQKSLDWLDILNRDGQAGFPTLKSVELAMRRVA